jgi:IrrE N-terminal-like domain
MLIHIQMRGARYVAPAHRWTRDYGRHIKAGARPLVILQPMGPVMFVFDVADTEPLPGAPPLPAEVERPFEVRRGNIGGELKSTVENAKRDGIGVTEQRAGSQGAGSIQMARGGNPLRFQTQFKPEPKYLSVPLRYALLLNSNLSAEARYATLAHELAHLYCGHLGTPNDKWWPDRGGLALAAAEFEAESVCYLVCERLGIDNPSDEYLAGYLGSNEQIPSISLDCVMKAAGLIERMGRERLGARKEKE